jgi:DNA mismatch repair protein MutL
MKIRVLADRVVNQIAAGEVVDRPASVIRELVDNALDAGADDISIWIESGGKSLIRVVDNGCGMERDDALLAFERHATSKLTSSDDLLSIQTMGFRGEALASIAAVSKAKLRTRQEEGAIGTEVVIEGGVLRNVLEVATPVGTEIEIRRIFFNTPARRKFLKLPKTEEQRVKVWLKHAALAHPDVRFRLTSDGKEVLNLSRRDDSISRAREYFRGSLVQFEREEDEIVVSGLIGHPGLAQYDSASTIILVNGRLISDRLVLKSLRDGFDSTLKPREFPIGFIRIDVHPASVDVNVHPQKSEVRFRDPSRVYGFVRDAVSTAIQQFRSPVQFKDVAPAAMTRPQPSIEAHSELHPTFHEGSLALQPRVVSSPQSALQPFAQPQALSASLASATQGARQADSPFRFSQLRYIGQALQCYLFCEFGEQVYVVDMHAAHERYNYNLIRNGFVGRSIASQQLLVPLTIELSEIGARRCVEHADLFARFGFGLELFGESSILIRSVPDIVVGSSVESLIKEVAAVAEEEGAGALQVDEVFQQVIDRVAARIACHASIRSGKQMNEQEVYALFDALDSSDFSAACPHGRPVVVSFKEPDIEKWFGRDK